MLRRRA